MDVILGVEQAGGDFCFYDGEKDGYVLFVMKL